MILTSKNFENHQISAISRLFSASVIREMARNGRSPLFKRLVIDLVLQERSTLQEPVSKLFDTAFSILKQKKYRQFRHEYIYKAALTHKILLGKHNLQTASMVNEFRVGLNIADTVIFNGTSTVYEIKSERDSLARLAQQLSSYQKVFAKVNIITGENHLNAVLSIAPENIGILLLSDRFKIKTLREAVDCHDRTSPEEIFNSIQLSEAKQILSMNGIEPPKLPNTKMHAALKSEFSRLTSAEAHNGMVQVLRKTRNLSPLADLIKNLPVSLQAAALSSSLRKQDHTRLLAAVDTPIGDALNWT